MKDKDGSRQFWLICCLAAALQARLATTDLYTAQWNEAGARWDVAAVAVAAALFALFALASVAARDRYIDTPQAEGSWWPLLLVLILATILRVYRLNGMPPGFFQDEAINGRDALALGDAQEWQFWSASISGRPTLFLYGLLATVRLGGNSYLALKILPVTIGVATVATTYCLGRLLFGRQVGVWAALLLACSRWHIHYSRMAWEAICAPLFATGGLALLVYAVRQGGYRWFAAAGIVSALGLYTYAGYRAVPLVAAMYAVLVVWQQRDAALVRGLGVATAAFAAIGAPLAIFAWLHPELFWERYREVSLANATGSDPTYLLHQLGKSILSFHHRGDALVRHNLPFAAHLDVITGTLMLIGAAASLAWRARLDAALLWLWLAVLVALSSATREAPHATRLLAAAPAAALFAGLGAAVLVQRLTARLRVRALRLALVAAVAVAIAGLNAHGYFVRHANDPNIDMYFNVLARKLCEEARARRDATVFWTEDLDYWASAQCKYLARDTRLALFPITVEQLLAGPPEVDPPILIAVGLSAIRDSGGRIKVGSDGLPSLPMPVAPELIRDRNNKLYYIYRIEPDAH
ncbi:MAG TPA: glycosyltransferase family 39 protein [Terriglobales bacterium]|nr:glycosyltransferase family 39 protein [Terriglobales bacterium]